MLLSKFCSLKKRGHCIKKKGQTEKGLSSDICVFPSFFVIFPIKHKGKKNGPNRYRRTTHTQKNGEKKEPALFVLHISVTFT
jgi:hypothetical protein